MPEHESMRERLHRLRHDRQLKLGGKLENAFVPVVRHEAEIDACRARFAKPHRNIARDRVGIARQDGVIDVEQRMTQPQIEQIALNVDVRYAREVALRFEKAHLADPTPFTLRRDGVLMLLVSFAEVVVHPARRVLREVEEQVVRLLGAADRLQALDRGAADGRRGQTRVRISAVGGCSHEPLSAVGS